MVRIAIGLGLCATLAANAQTIDVGDRRQLLLDDRFVRQAKGITFDVHPPRKTGEISIPSEEARALGGYANVLYDGGQYHMWYTAKVSICYARSKDGIHWERPALGIAKIPGWPENNVVIGQGAGDVKGDTHGVLAFIDPKAPASERFKLVANPHEFSRMLQLFASPDGIHWKLKYKEILTFDENKKPHHLDSQNVIFWDDRLGRYVAYVRRSSMERNRMVARIEADNLAKLGVIEDTRVIFDASKVEIPSEGRPLVDTYTNGAIKYPWAEDAYFLFPSMYYHYTTRQGEFRKDAPTNAGVLDARFAASRDGIEWNTYDWRPWVRLGMQGDFDGRRVYMGQGIVPAINGREMYMYYLGTNDTHGWDRDDRNNRLLTAAGVAPRPLERGISRVVMRRDGFVSARAGVDGGEFTTPPLEFKGVQLVLNVDTSALGEVQVEILDASGKPIEGFSLADADIIHSANEISRPVTWNGAASLEKLKGRTIRLHFLLRNADVYAFQFRNRPSI